VVGEGERRRTRASLAAIDGDEIGAAARGGHARAQRLPEAELADGRLDADRQSGLLGEPLDKLDQPVDVGECRVRGRAHAVLAGGDATHGRDLG
jgi:hypothetical protein